MRRLFFIVCCILALDICFAGDWWGENFIIGAHWGPPLHHKDNEPDSPLVRNFNLLRDGGFNFIVDMMNDHNRQADSFLNANKESLIVECYDSSSLFLVEPKDSTIAPEFTYGFNIKDEPSLKDTSKWLDTLRNLQQRYPGKLGFINLLPSYGFGSFNEWKSYVDAYLGDTTLQVACFDNYFPHSEFQTDPAPAGYNYYANLAYMKQLAGSRPLWAYLRSSESFLEEKNSAWQDAYIRLGAFAPLAFGAKGIIYFCYDCKDRNRILRSPGRGSWGCHAIFFDSDQKSRQIFFGNLKTGSNSTYPDLAVHTNDSLGTWRIMETASITNSQKLTTIGTWFGDHIHHIPNLYNWTFSPSGHDRFTTITTEGRLLLSAFRSGWTHYVNISGFPTAYFSTMSRHTCPFADFNGNEQLDLCLGWTENGQGKLWILLDCHLDPSHTPTPRNNPMLFDDTSQTFTFGDSIKQVITQGDSVIVITSNTASTVRVDSVHVLKHTGGQFGAVYDGEVTLPPTGEIDHYWMEEKLCGQDNEGDVWEEAAGTRFNMTDKNNGFSDKSIYVWGQYNSRTHEYDRYGLSADKREHFQSYALLNRKGNPNRIYYTAQTINQFINDSISPVIMNNVWLGAYFSSTPNQGTNGLSHLKIINKIQRGDTIPNPLPLINDEHTLTTHVLFGLYKERYGDKLYLLIINMKETTHDVIFSINKTFNDDSIFCNTITRMFHAENSYMEHYTNRTKIILNNMHGGECALLRLTTY